MKRHSFIVRLVINAIVFLVVSSLYSGINVDSFWAALVAALVLGLLNALVKPFLFIVTLPINILTFGLFTFVLNGIILLLAGSLYSGLQVAGFGSAIVGAILFAIVNAVLSALLVDHDRPG